MPLRMHLSRYMARVTSSAGLAVLMDQTAETVETYDLVVAASRASRRQAQVPEAGWLRGTCVRALKRPIFVQTSRRQTSDCSKRDSLRPPNTSTAVFDPGRA